MALKIHVFYRPQNSATATECKLSYDENWAQEMSGGKIGGVKCKDGSTYNLVKTGNSVSIDGFQQGLADIDNVDIYFAVDDNKLLKFGSEAEVKAHFEEGRAPEVRMQNTVLKNRGPLARLSLGVGGSLYGKETTTLAQDELFGPAMHEGRPFEGWEGSLEVNVVPAVLIPNKRVRFIASFADVGIYLNRTFRGTINDDYTASPGNDGEYRIMQLGLDLGIRTSLDQWMDFLSDVPNFDVYFRYATPLLGINRVTGKFAHSGGSRPVDVDVNSDDFITPFVDQHLFQLGGCRNISKHLCLGGFASLRLRNTTHTSPELKDWAVLGGIELAYNHIAKETVVVEGDKTVTLEPAEPVVIAQAPPPPPPEPPPVQPEPKPEPPAPFQFEVVDFPKNLQSEASAETTFDFGKPDLKGGYAGDPSANQGVKEVLAIVEKYIEALEEIGITGTKFNVEIKSGADFAGTAVANRKLSEERSKSFINGSYVGTTTVKGFDEELRDSEVFTRTSSGINGAITPIGMGETEPVAYLLSVAKNAKPGVIKTAVLETIGKINSGDARPAQVTIKDETYKGPYFKADGTPGTITDAKNGGFGIFTVKGGQKYLVNYQASRRVVVNMKPVSVPRFANVVPSNTPQITAIGTSYYKVAIASDGLKQTPDSLSDSDLSNFLGAIKQKTSSDYPHPPNKRLVVVVTLPNSKRNAYGEENVVKIAKWLGVAAATQSAIPVEVIVVKTDDRVKEDGITIFMPTGDGFKQGDSYLEKDLIDIIK